jgi:chaperonin GroES
MRAPATHDIDTHPTRHPALQNARLVSQTVGGVLLANDNADKPTFGVVVSVGAGSKNEETGEVVKPNVTVGTTVMYSKYSGSEFEEDDENYIVVRESDILAALA